MDIKNILFISDLDGTLFNSKAEISTSTANIINRIIYQGANFSFATARSIYSALPMTKSLNINIPFILMNGVSIYDHKNKYIKNEYIPKKSSIEISELFKKHNIKGFLYRIVNNILYACYTEITDNIMQSFAEERKNKFGKPFIQCNDFKNIISGENEIYFTTTGEYKKLLPLKNDIANLEHIDFAFYEDNYTKKWFLEIFSKKASKANAIKFMRSKYGFKKVVCFGDNLNDISMFNESDLCIAVENAKPELKQKADIITLSNDNDGVALWLYENILNP
ncbi:MAG: HAD family hydrolase [Oscillospiraceae bacterium]|nr:HAD family hydrolase [Oscillospiraceae bacterium]